MLTSYRKIVNDLEIKHQLLSEQLASAEEELQALRDKERDHQEAKDIIKAAAAMTQELIGHRLGDLVSLALASIWDDPYELTINFVPRRDTTECDLLFTRDGQNVNPFDSSGYGAIDIASMALRISYWSVKKNRNCIIWDEPARQLSSNKHSLASQWLKTVSEQLDIQFIIVSHQDELIDSAHKVIEVEMRQGRSMIK